MSNLMDIVMMKILNSDKIDLEHSDDVIKKNVHRMATKWAEANCWGITLDDFRFFIYLHANGNQFIKQYVEDILEDCNFHTINKFIHSGDYLNAYYEFLKEFDFGEGD